MVLTGVKHTKGSNMEKWKTCDVNKKSKTEEKQTKKTLIRPECYDERNEDPTL